MLGYIALFTFLMMWLLGGNPFGVHNFFFESMVLQAVQVVLLVVVLLLVGFGDAVMYDGALILFNYEDDFGYLI